MLFCLEDRVVDFRARKLFRVASWPVFVEFDALRVQRFKLVSLVLLIPVSQLCLREVFGCFLCMLLWLDPFARLVCFRNIPAHNAFSLF